MFLLEFESLVGKHATLIWLTKLDLLEAYSVWDWFVRCVVTPMKLMFTLYLNAIWLVLAEGNIPFN